jgi:hypothetical protein
MYMTTFERLALLGPWVIVGVFFIVAEFVLLPLWVLLLAMALYPFLLWFAIQVWEN